MTHRVVPLMYLLDDTGVVGHATAGRSSTIQGILTRELGILSALL